MPEATVPQVESKPAVSVPKSSLIIGIPKEVHPGEKRVAAVPATVVKMRKLGMEVLVEAGAGEGASFLDAAYVEAGARIVPTAKDLYAQANFILKVRGPMPLPDGDGHEADLLAPGAKLVSFLWPAQHPELLARLAQRKATVLAVDMVPRITRAQKLDALSAMANIAGYKAVIEGASRFGRFLGGQITAAGKVRPAQIFVIGAGVAGLAAVGAGRALGAIVKAFDTRAAVREQVESMGGVFVKFDFKETGEGEGGYAKEMSEAYLAAEHALIAQHCQESDIVITTALIPGKPAPKLITSGAVVGMRHGSVIVDLAAEQGGNCALTVRDEVVEKYGVTIVGLTDLTSRMAQQSSELYASTLANLLDELITDGEMKLDLDDEVHRTMLVLKDGELMWPPPKPVVRAKAPQPEAPKAAAVPAAAPAPAKKKGSPVWGWIGTVGAAALLTLIGLTAPPTLVSHLTVFLLACVVGWHVIWNVTPALHTPLMSVTNAISGIIVLGGMLLTVGLELETTTWLGAAAVLVASINVAGGFLVTRRMLRMFHR